ncbi:hypothetical protein [Brevibacillus sp. NRS-1366]|uniref:hypothetical protein n=1 Tax=Brevibacillus sp. NRS-1366 TaxID=3233899 RepID=UPI003D1D7EBF
MTKRISASEIIRKVALKILGQHSDGLQFSTLKMYAEKELGSYIEYDTEKKGKYRSALWNLDLLYPEYVIKGGQDRRDKRFFPTTKLHQDFHMIELPNLDVFLEQEREKELKKSYQKQLVNSSVHKVISDDLDLFNVMAPSAKMSHISKSLNLIAKEIELSNIILLINSMLLDSEKYTIEEIEALSRLKFCLDIIMSYRNEMFHGKI